MAKKRRKFDLGPLDAIVQDLRVPSLNNSPPRLEGFAYRFAIVFPLLSETGEEVFSQYHLYPLLDLFNRRFGGCLASSSLAYPSWFGSYLSSPEVRPVKDYHTLIYVYTKQVDAADRFFQLLKVILKRAGFQDEILIERSPVWLVEGAAP